MELKVEAKKHTDGFLPLRAPWFEMDGEGKHAQISYSIMGPHLVVETTDGNYLINMVDLATEIMKQPSTASR